MKDTFVLAGSGLSHSLLPIQPGDDSVGGRRFVMPVPRLLGR